MTFEQKNKVIFGASLNSGRLASVLKAHSDIFYPLHFFLQHNPSLLCSILAPVSGQITCSICQSGEKLFAFVTSDDSTDNIIVLRVLMCGV